MEWQEARLCLTSRGADYINGIIPLFFSERSKVELMALAADMGSGEEGEKEYLVNHAAGLRRRRHRCPLV